MPTAVSPKDINLDTLRKIVEAQERIAAVQNDRKEAMRTICEEAIRITLAEGGAVEMAEGEMMVYRAVCGSAIPFRDLAVRQSDSLTGLALRRGEILICEDSEKDPRVDLVACRKVGLRSMIVVPLVFGGRKLGILKVLSSKPGQFGPEGAQALRLMAGFLSTALAHAEDHEKRLESERGRAESLERERDARKKAERALHELESERKLRERFVQALTHDLRTPLTAVRASVQFLQRTRRSDQETGKWCQRAISSLDRMDHMIRDMLDANRISAGKLLPIQPTICDLLEVIELAMEDIRLVHGERVVFRKPLEALPGSWDGDAIRRMLDNLLENSIKYGDRLSPVTLSLRSDALHGIVEISVHNWGPAIPKEGQARLFHAFHRTHEAEKSAKLGWGLGLSLVQGLAEAHGGKVRMKSNSDEGTTFTVVLPWRGFSNARQAA